MSTGQTTILKVNFDSIDRRTHLRPARMRITRKMDPPKQATHDLLERIRNHRLTATFALLATLSLGILAGSILTRSVSGKEQTVDSSDARPLTVPNPVNLSNDFSKIAKQ